MPTAIIYVVCSKQHTRSTFNSNHNKTFCATDSFHNNLVPWNLSESIDFWLILQFDKQFQHFNKSSQHVLKSSPNFNSDFIVFNIEFIFGINSATTCRRNSSKKRKKNIEEDNWAVICFIRLMVAIKTQYKTTECYEKEVFWMAWAIHQWSHYFAQNCFSSTRFM